MTTGSRALFVLACLAHSTAGSGLAQPTAQGGEFQVNVRTAGYQEDVKVARDASGNFVLVWADKPSGFSTSDLFARRFDASGGPQGTVFQVNAYTLGDQYRPAVARADAGHFVVVWEGFLQDGSGSGIFARRFSAAGAPLAVEFQVNSRTLGSQITSDVGAAANGDFVVVWDGGGDYGLLGQRFLSGGARVGVEFAVNAITELNQFTPSIGVDDDGDFAVAWKNGFGGSYEVVTRRFNSAGAGGADLQVNTYVTGDQEYPDLAMDSDGDFVVAWQSLQDSSSHGIVGRLFNSLGAPVGGEFSVNTYTTSAQNSPAVAVDDKGNFVIAWRSHHDGSSSGVFAQHFAADARRLGGEFQVNTYTPSYQSEPDVATDPGGNFVVAWQSFQQDGSYEGVFAQRFSVPRILDIDGNNQVTALTDGLLVVRFLFGFTGTTLTNGVIGANCTRCDAAAIVPYLEGLV